MFVFYLLKLYSASFWHANVEKNLYRISIGLIISVGSKYGSNGNYDGNDGFSTSQIENKTRKNTLFFSIRIQYLSQD